MLPMQLPFKEADLPCVTRLQVLKFIGYDLRDPIPGDECSITPNINPYEIPDMTFCYDVYFMSASKTRPFKSRWSRKEHPNLLEWIIDLPHAQTSVAARVAARVENEHDRLVRALLLPDWDGHGVRDAAPLRLLQVHERLAVLDGIVEDNVRVRLDRRSLVFTRLAVLLKLYVLDVFVCLQYKTTYTYLIRR